MEATAEAERSRLKYKSQWGGVNTTVAAATAQLKESEAAHESKPLRPSPVLKLNWS